MDIPWPTSPATTFDVVPFAPSGKTQIHASYYVTATEPALYDQFILEKPR